MSRPLTDCQDALDAFMEEYLPETPKMLPNGDIPTNGHLAVSDDEVIAKASSSKGGQKFKALMDGDSSGYPSESEARFALLNQLTFWTQDASQLDSIFRKSGLHTSKWERLGESEISKVLDSKGEHYAWPCKSLSLNSNTQLTAETTPATKGDRSLTQIGNSERFVDAFANEFHWVPEWGWMRFDSARWQRCQDEEVEHQAKSVVRGIYREASEKSEEESRTKIAAWAKQSESLAQLTAMVNLAKGDLVHRANSFDRHPMLFNVANGTINLATQQIRPHDPQDFLTKMSPVEFDQEATCPHWMGFLKRIFHGAPEIIGYLQAVLGYSLSGYTKEQMALILYGLGENGKTTFIETLLALFGPGEYAAKASFETFLDANKGGPRDDLAALAGCRLVVGAESAAGRNLNETLLKEITGGDTITARFLYKGSFSFRPQFQLWLATNNKPVIREQTHALWRRLRLIRFAETITAEERDSGLAEKLQMELAGILNWALAGYRIYLEEGLATPESVVNETEDYRSDEDPLTDFFDGYCVLETESSQAPGPLYQAYKNLCDSTGQKALTQAWFSRVLAQKGIRRANRTGGSRGDYIGIRLRRTDEHKQE